MPLYSQLLLHTHTQHQTSSLRYNQWFETLVYYLGLSIRLHRNIHVQSFSLITTPKVCNMFIQLVIHYFKVNRKCFYSFIILGRSSFKCRNNCLSTTSNGGEISGLRWWPLIVVIRIRFPSNNSKQIWCP